MASALQLAPRDIQCVISGSGYAAGTAVTRVQDVSIPLRHNTEDAREIGTTNFWTINGEPSVEATINRNLIGDLEVPQLLNGSFVSGSAISDCVWDSTGDLIRKNIYMLGGDGTEIIWGAKDCFLTSASFAFDAGGLATESWAFEGQEMTDDTALANITESEFTGMVPASGYGGIRHDKISVQLLGTSLSNAIKERITSVNITATINRTAMFELFAVEDGGNFGPYARIVDLPFDVTASIDLMPSENFDKIAAELGSWNSPKTLAESTAVLKVFVRRGDAVTTYEIPRVVRTEVTYNADVGTGGTFSLGLRGLDVKVYRV